MKRKWKALIVALTVTLLFAAVACAQAEGVLKRSEGEDVFGGPIAQEEVRSVTFVDTLADAPADAWDASEAGDGSVLAWAEKSGDLYDVTVGGEGGVMAGSCRSLFSFENMEEIHFNGCFDTSRATDMSGMFMTCHRLKALDLSDLDTSVAMDMNRMFAYCDQLEALDLSGFDTHGATQMHGMFQDCTNLEKVDLSSFDTSKVGDMRKMFNYTKALEHIYASDKFAIGANTDTTDMFVKCKAGELTYASAPAAEEEEPAAEEGTSAEAKAPAGDYETLQRGDKGDAVAKFQAKLVEHNYLADVADGDFGGKTGTAVKQLQADAGLEQTGVADAATQAALEDLTAEFEPKNGYAALLYWGEYDADSQTLAWYVKNTGKYSLNGIQLILQQCDASKKALGDFAGNKERSAINVYPGVILEGIQPGESHRFTISEVTESAFFSDSAYVSIYIGAIAGYNDNGEMDGVEGDRKKIYIPLG